MKPPNVSLVGTTAQPLSFKFTIKGRRATIAALLKPVKDGRCPKAAKAVARDGKKLVAKTRLAVRKKGALCRAAGTLRLRTKPRRSTKLTVTLTAKGVESRVLAPTR